MAKQIDLYENTNMHGHSHTLKCCLYQLLEGTPLIYYRNT